MNHQEQRIVDPGKCPGCGGYFKGERGLRAHQASKFVTLACRPVRKAGA